MGNSLRNLWHWRHVVLSTFGIMLESAAFAYFIVWMCYNRIGDTRPDEGMYGALALLLVVTVGFASFHVHLNIHPEWEEEEEEDVALYREVG